MKTAQEFYGAAFTPARASLLEEAYKWLLKAITFEAMEGGESKMNMAFNAALKKEADAFAL